MSSPPVSHMPAAATHALLIPDILFSVVPHLDFHSLLHGQRVCQTWKFVISRSRTARQILFLETDSSPFEAFEAAEERDIAARTSPAWQPPQNRIRSRPEFRAMFNPWIFTHGCEAINSVEIGAYSWAADRRGPPTWRFTDRVSSGRLEFCLTRAQLARFVNYSAASCNEMFLTQPPVKRVLIAVQGGYMQKETADLEEEGGVKVGHVLSFMRMTKAVAVICKRKGSEDFTTVDLEFDEHFTGVRFMLLQQLLQDGYGNVFTRTF